MAEESFKFLSVLVIGAASNTGTALIRHLSHEDTVEVHALDTRTPSNEQLCASVEIGNARNTMEVREAVESTNAQWIVLCFDDDKYRDNIRRTTAQAVGQVMRQYSHLRAIVLSRVGAGNSRVRMGMGLGLVWHLHRRFAMWDNTLQEKEFARQPSVQSQTIVVRTTAVVDRKRRRKSIEDCTSSVSSSGSCDRSFSSACSNVSLVSFGDREKVPSIQTYRDDLVEWISDSIIHQSHLGSIINLSSVRRPRS